MRINNQGYRNQYGRYWSETQLTAQGSASLTIPAGVRQGDLLVMGNGCGRSGSTPTLVIPSGFTQVITQTTPFHPVEGRVTIAMKVADGSEAGQTLNGMNHSVNKLGLIVARLDQPLIHATVVAAASAGEIPDDFPHTLVLTPPNTWVNHILAVGCYFVASSSSEVTGTMTPGEEILLGAGDDWWKMRIGFRERAVEYEIFQGDHGSGNNLAGALFGVA